jgi:hypothetical protein
MSKPNEITEEILKSRIRLAVAKSPENGRTIEEDVEIIYREGNFVEFVGIVERTTAAVRQEGAAIARRHNHHVTAEKIRRGGK